MKKLLVLGAFLLATLSVSTQPADAKRPSLSGLWLIQFYVGPNHVKGAALCVRFVQTNNIAGYRKFSGTWQTTNGALSGQWIQNGNDVMWYGANAKQKLSYFSVGDMQNNSEIGGTGYAQFKSTNGVTAQAGSWTGDKVNRCTASDE